MAVGTVPVVQANGTDCACGAAASHWNGQAWTSLPLPAAFTQGGIHGLSGVSCPKTNSCIAVGALDGQVLRWRGDHWTADTLPLPAGAGSLSLNAIDCPAADNCHAVGGVSLGTSPQTTSGVAATWNGTSWSTELLPDDPRGAVALDSI